jgi:putative spermidine/putrescine transport system ATP-binding protein
LAHSTTASATGHSLALANVSHRFAGVVAANDISLDIKAGELVSLLGPSGCGKTTLLKIISGFLRQTSGEVLVDGVSITDLPPNRRQIGIVFQNYALFPHMTVADNIAYGPAAAGRSRRECAATAAEMLDLVQLAAFRDRFPRELSGGQQQRVALARCLAIRPRILLLDEPFSALDKTLRLDMQIEIKRLQRQSGITTILVTHDQEEALSMSDRIAVLSRGRLEQFASPADIYDRPASLFVNGFVGTANFLNASVLDSGGGSTRIRLAGGTEITVPIATSLATGARAIASFRPESVRLGPVDAHRDPDTIGLAARITAIMPIGPSLIYQIVLANGSAARVVQERTGKAAFAEGTDVMLKLDPNKINGLFSDPTNSPTAEPVAPV